MLLVSLLNPCMLFCEIDTGGEQMVATSEDDYREIRDNAPDTQEDKESGLYDARHHYLLCRDVPIIVKEKEELSSKLKI